MVVVGAVVVVVWVLDEPDPESEFEPDPGSESSFFVVVVVVDEVVELVELVVWDPVPFVVVVVGTTTVVLDAGFAMFAA